MPPLWKWMMVILVLCLIASFAIGSYKLITTPVETFTPAPGAWDTLEWPQARPAGEAGA